MIYPQSFPNIFSSQLEEQVYEVLSKLLEENYASFYVTELKIDEKKKIILDFIIVDKKRGVLIVEVKGSSKNTSNSNVSSMLKKSLDTLEKEFKKLKLSTNVNTKTALWEHSKNSIEQFQDWFNSVLSKDKLEIIDSDFQKIKQYLKTINKYYTPFGKIQSFDFKNFKGIKHAHLKKIPISASWLFLTGENGFGKTCLLQAIAISLYGQNPEEYLDNSFNTSFSGSSMVYEEVNQKVQLKVSTQDTEQENTYIYPKPITNKNYRNVCAYGASRLDTYDIQLDKKNPILSLFDTKSLLANIEPRLQQWNSSTLVVDNQKFEKTKELLEKLLDGMEISVSKTSHRVWYTENRKGESYEPILIHNLAAGYRSMLAMVGDIIINLFDTQPDIINPADLEGIVIIDELDLHWHPKWQKRIPSLFTELFPKIQFIASTHSPVPLLGAPEDSVFLKVNRTVEDGITVVRLKEMEQKIKNLLPNIILTSPIFDMDDIKAITNKDITAININESLDEEKFYELVDKKIEELFLEDKFHNYDSNKKKHKK